VKQLGKLELMAADEYARRYGADCVRLRPREVRAMAQTRVFPPAAAGNLPAVQTDFGLPQLSVVTIKNAILRGESNLATTSTGIVHHDLFDIRRDALPEVFFERLAINENRRRAKWKSLGERGAGRLEAAAGFTDACSHNYAHWLTEVLPRIFLLATCEDFAVTPIVLDAQIHANFRRSADLILGDGREIHCLKPSELLSVDNLHFVSHAGYVPFKRLTKTDLGHSHGVFSGGVLSDMVRHLQRRLGLEDRFERRRIYIRRRSHVRHLVNDAEIEDRLVAAGFTIVEPEKLTFDEQVELFSEAEIVVGATGSALANLIFCPATCPVIILISNFRQTPYWYWHNMASAVGNQVVHVVGQSLAPDDADPFEPDAPHADFRVEVSDIFDAIDSVRARRSVYWERY
jgi:hypothetical protein